MIKLEMSFSTVEEVTSFLSGKSLPKATTIAAEVPPVIQSVTPTLGLTKAQKSAKTKAENKAKREAAALAAPAMKAEDTAAGVFAQTAPVSAPIDQPVSPAPVAESSPERDALLIEAQGLITEMKTLGVRDEDVMPKIQESYAKLGIPYIRMSELNPSYLPLVVNEVRGIVYHIKAQTANTESYV